MNTFIALLRAINVGGTGKLAMKDLATLCEQAGGTQVRTYIQSGNVVFRTRLAERTVKRALEDALTKKLGKPARVLLRRLDAFERTLAEQPFPSAAPNRVIVMFYDRPIGEEEVADLAAPDGEELHLCGRELHIHYPNGQGRSKLKLPSAAEATGRNLNTLRKLAELAHGLE